MRHRNRRGKLSMRGTQRRATMINMVKSLFKYQKIETIHARAKEARRLAERLITLSKDSSLAARRRAYAILGERDLVFKLFKEIGPLFKNRTSGFTRIIPLKYRLGDGASIVILELTENNLVEKLTKKKAAKKEAAKASSAASAEHKAAHADKDESKKEKAAGEEGHIKPAKDISKAKPTLQEEKRAEKSRAEDKKMSGQRGFMKNLRGLFHKRGD